MNLANGLIILLLEVISHRNGGTGFSLLEFACLRTHVKANIGDFVSLVMSIAGHDNSSFEFVDNCLLEFNLFWRLVGVAGSSLGESIHLLVNELVTVINGEIL